MPTGRIMAGINAQRGDCANGRRTPSAHWFRMMRHADCCGHAHFPSTPSTAANVKFEIMRPFVILFALFSSSVFTVDALAQSALKARVAKIAADAQGTVSVSCLLPGTALNCDLHPHNHSPMQSMFKFPLALTVLHLADAGKLLATQRPGESISITLGRTVRFLPEDRIPHTYSPLQDRYPEANVDVPLRELVQLAAGESDNAATETLLRIIGGPSAVQDYVHSLGITEFQLQDGEHGLNRDPTAQYRNWIEPAAAVQLLERLVSNPPLSSSANDFLVQTLTASVTGSDRLRAGLPAGTVLAHKTGTSGEHNGKAEATNDIGLITLPDGRRLAVAVFVTDARANEVTRNRVIASIGRAAYDEALHTYGPAQEKSANRPPGSKPR
jgi:beta-lactamase class A